MNDKSPNSLSYEFARNHGGINVYVDTRINPHNYKPKTGILSRAFGAEPTEVSGIETRTSNKDNGDMVMQKLTARERNDGLWDILRSKTNFAGIFMGDLNREEITLEQSGLAKTDAVQVIKDRDMAIKDARATAKLTAARAHNL